MPQPQGQRGGATPQPQGQRARAPCAHTAAPRIPSSLCLMSLRSSSASLRPAPVAPRLTRCPACSSAALGLAPSPAALCGARWHALWRAGRAWRARRRRRRRPWPLRGDPARPCPSLASPRRPPGDWCLTALWRPPHRTPPPAAKAAGGHRPATSQPRCAAVGRPRPASGAQKGREAAWWLCCHPHRHLPEGRRGRERVGRAARHKGTRCHGTAQNSGRAASTLQQLGHGC